MSPFCVHVVLKIDTDEHIKLAESFGVTGLPDIRLLSADGKRKKQLHGFQTVDAIIPELEAFLASRDEERGSGLFLSLIA